MSGIPYAPLSPIKPWPEFNSLQFILLNQPVNKNYVDTTFLMLSGGNMTGPINAINISMTGTLTTSGSISMSNAGSNLTIAGTLSIPSSSLYINSIQVNASAAQLNYLISTPGAASASTALILDSSRNITNINNLTLTGALNSNTISITGTTDSTSTITGCLTLSGGIGIAKSLYIGTSSNVTNPTGGDMYTLTSTSTSARNTIKFIGDVTTFEFGTRNSTATNPNTMYIYNGGYKLLMNTTGDTQILSTTDSSSQSTGCLTLSGGLGVVKNIYTTGTLTTNRNGSNISILNGANSALIELDATPNLRIVRGGGYCVNIGASGINVENTSTRTPRYALDFGAAANDVIVNLFQGTVGSTLYGIGANNSALELHSAGAITMYNGTTGNGALGTRIFTADSSGNVWPSAGLHTNGFSTSGLSSLGNAAHIHYTGGIATFIGYNYNSSTYVPMQIGPLMQVGTNGGVNINTTNQSTNFPLAVFGSSNATRTLGNYGWLASSGAGNVVGANFTRAFSIYADFGILISSGEIDCFSDVRIKKNINKLNDKIAETFINKIKPITFQYKKGDQNEKLGYSAQELLKYDLHHLVGVIDNINDEDDLEDMTIECINGDIKYLDKNHKLVVNQLSIIPILHKAIQISNRAIKKNEKKIKKLYKLLRRSNKYYKP